MSSSLRSITCRASVSARRVSRINLAVATRLSIVALTFLSDHMICSIVRRGQLAVSLSNGPQTRTYHHRLLQTIRPAKGQANNCWRGKDRVRAPKRDCRSHQGAATTATTATAECKVSFLHAARQIAFFEFSQHKSSAFQRNKHRRSHSYADTF